MGEAGARIVYARFPRTSGMMKRKKAKSDEMIICLSAGYLRSAGAPKR